MQDFIPQARAHSLPDENPLDENPLPDVSLCPPAPACSLPDVNPLPDVSSLLQVAQLPDVNLHSDVSIFPGVTLLPDVNLHPDVTLSTLHLAFLLAKLSPLKLHQGCVGPTWDPPT